MVVGVGAVQVSDIGERVVAQDLPPEIDEVGASPPWCPVTVDALEAGVTLGKHVGWHM